MRWRYQSTIAVIVAESVVAAMLTGTAELSLVLDDPARSSHPSTSDDSTAVSRAMRAASWRISELRSVRYESRRTDSIALRGTDTRRPRSFGPVPSMVSGSASETNTPVTSVRVVGSTR